MSTPRRFYIYAVSAISLNAFAWSVISLLRDLIISGFGSSTESVAFQLAVILISLPIFLIHWFWAERLSAQEVEERGAVLRRVYLYGTQASFLVPVIDSGFAIASTLLFLPSNQVPRSHYPPLSSGDSFLYYTLALLVLIPLWYFQHRVNREDAEVVSETGSAAVVRRLFVFSFSAAGLLMTITATTGLLRWLLFQIGGEAGTGVLSGAGPAYEVARLILDLPVWLIFWLWADRLFNGPDEEERASVLRKFYLYLVVFLSAMATVTSITFILEGFFRRLLQVRSFEAGEDDIRIPISIIIAAGLVWAYHAYVIRDDAVVAKDLPRQRGIRRLHGYLIATIGLAAFLIGLGGILSVLIRALDETVLNVWLKRQLSWYAALTIAGLPVWFLPWDQLQKRAELPEEEGAAERRSGVRKGYLYIFIFVATMTVLSSVVFLVFKFLSMVFGDPAPSMSELGHAIAFIVIAVGLWLYHGSALRGDGRREVADQLDRIKDFLVVVVGSAEDGEIEEIIENLRVEIPQLMPVPILLSKGQEAAQETVEGEDELSLLKRASVIVGPWVMAVSGWKGGVDRPEITAEILKSQAKKVLIPSRTEGWEWAGVNPEKRSFFVRQAARAVRQVLEGESVEPAKPLGAGAVIAIVIGGLILLGIIGIPLVYLLID